MKLNIFSLKTETLLEFLKLGSKLFHSIIADRKKESLKKLCFALIREIMPTVLAAHGVLLTGRRLKRRFVHFWKLDKWGNDEVEGILRLILGIFFYLTYLGWLLLLLNRHYVGGFHFCVEELLKAWSLSTSP